MVMRNKELFDNSGINVQFLEENAIANLEESFEDGLDDCLDLLQWAIRDNKSNDVYVWWTVLESKYGLNVEEILPADLANRGGMMLAKAMGR